MPPHDATLHSESSSRTINTVTTVNTVRESEPFVTKMDQLPVTREDTLYTRLGGKDMVERITHEFFVEIGGEQGLAHFFVNVPVAAIQLHQGKFFKVLFDVEEERPSPEELLDYMVATHVRLFRDLGLNATHFDIVGGCFVRAMNKLELSQDLLDECLAIIGPLRVAFDYGATVAEKEKTMDPETMKTLPHATMETMRASQEVVLPPGLPPPPDWLIETLGSRDKVRAWTCELTYRFTVEDQVLADTFMALPYLDMEPYLHKFLQLAFAESVYKLPSAHALLLAVRFPHGLTKAATQLNKILFDRMVGHFSATGNRLSYTDTAAATERLRAIQSSFVGTAPGRVGGLKTAHRLRHDPNAAKQPVPHEEEKIVVVGNPASSPKKQTKRKKQTKKSSKQDAAELKRTGGVWRRMFSGRRGQIKA